MQVRAKSKYIRQSPRKVRAVAAMIKNMEVGEARAQLIVSARHSSKVVLKTLESAIANALHNHNAKEAGMKIAQVFVDQGPTLKRWRARAFGRAAGIRKKMSHLTIIIEAEENKKPAKPAEPKKPAQDAAKPTEKKEEAAKEKTKEAKNKAESPQAKPKETNKKSK